ncbi:hypothetical protein HED60_04390 [Planctomycetales bacterium ZRK34]|nr:hypothetical protein HED60_04390 [Planctomycetales bacterium ZRK34]
MTFNLTTLAEDDTSIQLNLPENVELKILVDYVSERLNLNIFYDEQIANKRVTIKAPGKIPVESLLGLLESTLKMKGLALVDAEQPGWKRITQIRQLAEIAVPADEADRKTVAAVTQIFTLQYADAQRADQIIKPFLTPQSGNSIPLVDQQLLIVTDYVSNMARVSKMIAQVDQPGEPAVVRFVAVEHMEVQQLAQQLTQVLSAKAKGSSSGAGARSAQPDVEVLQDPRTNQLILVGSGAAVSDAETFAQSLDVSLNVVPEAYTFESASPEEVDRVFKELIGEVTAKKLYKSSVYKKSNMLIVTTTPDIHAKLAKLKTEVDQPVTESQRPIRFYKLENATATEVLATLRSIETEAGLGEAKVSGGDTRSMYSRAGRLNDVPGTTGPNQPPVSNTNQTDLPRPPGYRPSNTDAEQTTAGAIPTSSFGNLSAAVEQGKAHVMADVNTNTIIVVAPPAMQELYAQLIERLDRRRPQVLLEATIVTLDTSNGYSFGVEVSRTSDAGDKGKVLTFGSFGLSEVDADTGRLSLSPGLGFNGALVSADIADVIIRALKTNARSKVVSAPKILVSDNATGTLTSVNEAPFTSVNASDTVATTSFAGFASAGTTVTLTPHISEGDHLQLEYQIELNSFTGDGSETVPPPRQTNGISSEVLIPDGHTIIVGGLKRQDQTESRSTIPLVDQIPLLGDLIGNTSNTSADSSLFVFIRPVILRDDKFRDLLFYSNRDQHAAELASDYPTSKPMLIR